MTDGCDSAAGWTATPCTRSSSTADLFVNPAIRESFGIATLEARTAGVPVIARAGNGVSEFIQHGKEGLLCDDRDALVDAIVLLVRDADARRRIRTHNCTTQPTNCTWPVVTAAFARCYSHAAALSMPPCEPQTPEHSK